MSGNPEENVAVNTDMVQSGMRPVWVTEDPAIERQPFVVCLAEPATNHAFLDQVPDFPGPPARPPARLLGFMSQMTWNRYQGS